MQAFGRADKDDALLADGLLDVRVGRFAVELRFDAGEELALLLGNAEPLEGALDVVGNFVPRALRSCALGEVIADLVEVDVLEILGSPNALASAFPRNLR